MAATGLQYTEDEVKTVLLAVIAWNGNVAAAWKDIDENHGVGVSEGTIRSWVNKDHAVEYQRLRDEHAPQLEANLAHEFRNVAAQAVEVQTLALKRARERLEKNQDGDPAKTAAFAARAGSSAVDKLMTLTNRPEKIVESRDVNDVLRSLAARKVIKMIPEQTPVDSTAEDG